MRGLYLTAYDLTNKSDGVAKKILSQIACFKRFGIDMTIVDASNLQNVDVDPVKNFISRGLGTSYQTDLLYSYVAKMPNLSEYDFMYIRKGFCDKRQIEALRQIRAQNANLKILMEYPTFPYDKEIRGRKRLVALPIDQKYRKDIARFIDRAVTFSDDSELFGAKTLVISNAIDYDRVKISQQIEHDGVNMIAVALFGIFHGYDRLLMAMARDKELVQSRKIHFHLVGDGFAIKNYKDIVKKHSLEKYVTFHGRLGGELLDKVYDICDIAIDTLGRHRVGCYYNSSLKGKEYGAKGLPMISGVKTDLDKYKEDFYFRVSADESPIALKSIIDFYDDLVSKESKKHLSERIRNTTKKYFAYDVSFKAVLDYVAERDE